MIHTFLRWFVPPGFQDLLRGLRSRAETWSVDRSVLARNEECRNRHQDRRRCFILASGPSIKTQDLKKLQGETCFAVSNFFVHPDFEVIRPEYYVVPKLSFPPYTADDAVRWFTQ